uniref:Acyl-CoA thioesterase 9 n=1 Tax=Callorhinchus milii TaxID=7868 RepID=A0A4W3IWP4_CALMI
MNDVRNGLQDIVGASKTWSENIQAIKDRTSLSSLLVSKQEDLPVKRMKDSYLEVFLPLGSQPSLREKYLNVHNFVRFGRILEDLDSFGVLISYNHMKSENGSRSPFSIVTALVDEIDLCQKHILPDCDLKFTGNVSWVGKTSMEVQMHFQSFMFFSIYRPAFVNPLKAETPEEEDILRKGKLNKLKRINISQQSLFKMAPNEEERKLIHELFLNTLDPRTVSFRSRVLSENSVWIAETKLKGLEICHPQERNIHNKIFGGFLMRKAFELGWANACIYGNSRPHVVAVDDIIFQKPVEIGSLLYLSSQVCYTQQNHIQVRVHSEVVNPYTKEHSTTNVFHFTFCSDKEVARVTPKTYGAQLFSACLPLCSQMHCKPTVIR